MNPPSDLKLRSLNLECLRTSLSSAVELFQVLSFLLGSRSTYEVATACAIALQADKMLCLLDGPILDEEQRVLRFMTFQEADRLIRACAAQSPAAADYVKMVTEPSFVQSQGPRSNGRSGDHTNGAVSEPYRSITDDGSMIEKSGVAFAVGGKERLSRMNSYLSELTAAVFVCRVSIFVIDLGFHHQSAIFLASKKVFT
jgi:hypothetical protein